MQFFLEANLKSQFCFELFRCITSKKKVHIVKEPKMKRKQKDKIDSSVGHQSIEAVLWSNVSSCIIQRNGDFHGFENCLLCQSFCLFLLETYRPRKKMQSIARSHWLIGSSEKCSKSFEKSIAKQNLCSMLRVNFNSFFWNRRNIFLPKTKFKYPNFP